MRRVVRPNKNTIVWIGFNFVRHIAFIFLILNNVCKQFRKSIYISGLARPQGRPKKKKILSKINLKALKDRYGCQDTIISKCIFFHMLEIRGSHRAIVTKLSQSLVLMASLFCQSLKIFGPVEPEIWAVEYLVWQPWYMIDDRW